MRFFIVFITVCASVLATSCATTGKRTFLETSEKAIQEQRDPLTYEQRRKFDYFFLEAVRKKQKGDYDAAFELYSHCLDIYPESAAALYELSQFYLFLGQESMSEKALKKAVRSDEKNFWYKQTLASYYQNKIKYNK